MTSRLLTLMGILCVGAVAGPAVVSPLAGSPAMMVQPAMAADTGTSRCAALEGRVIAGGKVETAAFLAKGAKVPPLPQPLDAGICRVDLRISPVAGSDIKIQVWLPDRWNGKFIGVGGGGFNGGLASAPIDLRRWALKGYAGVATNAGHDVQPEESWALDSPQKIIDFAHRGNHLGAVVGQATVAVYYGRPASRTVFNGCSNGGRDALMLAQRYPADYDAIVAGAPANDWSGLMSWFARHEQIARISPGVDLLGPKLNLIHRAAVGKCDLLDGVKDGLIERPTTCRFDPAILQCKGAPGASCLSRAEVQAVRALYQDVRTRDGRLVQPGLPVGSEYQWSYWITSVQSGGANFARQFYRYMVHDDPSWDVARFDVSRDYPFARRKIGPVTDAVDPDLRPFLRRGGKLLMYHGWDDAAIPAGNTLNYYSAMRRVTGKAGAAQTRLFMLPGVEHCAGGNGPSRIDYVAELERWMDSGTPPERMVATKVEDRAAELMGRPVRVVATRPVCAWPKAARYKGAGALNDADSYDCR